jgi:hypothetical protein
MDGTNQRLSGYQSRLQQPSWLQRAHASSTRCAGAFGTMVGMSTKLGWFGIRERSLTTSIAGLRAVAAAKRKLALPEDGFHVATKRGNTAAVVMGWKYASVHDWALAISSELDTTTVSFLLLEGCWDYSIHRAGKQIAAMTWYPEEQPSFTGNLERAATALGVPVTLLRRYRAAILERIEAEDAPDEIHAFKGDKFEIGNEWAHCDLARRLGFTYPDPGKGKIVVIPAPR